MSSMMKHNEQKEYYQRKNGTVGVRTVNTEPSMTQQQFKDQCDVNQIIAKYKKTGEFVHVTRKNGIYADVSQITDYPQMLEKIIKADAAFMTLPAATRNRFQNDPAQLLAFMQDPKNHDEGVSLGIYEKMSSGEMPNAIPKNDSNEKLNAKGKTKTPTPIPDPE